MRTLFSILSYPILIICLALVAVGLYPILLSGVENFALYLWFGVGFGAYFILRFLPVIKKNEDFIQNHSHENIHKYVAMMFGQKIHSLMASNNNGGEVWHSGKRFGGLFIALAPYCFPIFTYAFILLRIIGAEEYLMWFDILIGLTLAFYVHCFAKQTRNSQPDIQKYGHLKSYLFIVTFWFFNATIILLTIRKGIIGAVTYLFPQYWNHIVLASNYIF